MHRMLLASAVLTAGCSFSLGVGGGIGSGVGIGVGAGRSREEDPRRETVEYRHREAVLEGYVVRPKGGGRKKVPGVLICHEWMGHGDYVRRRAEDVAKLGYVVLALDMYGKGVRAKDGGEAARFSGSFRRDRALMRDRAEAGLEALRRETRCDPDRVVAIGYCFGGTVALELARSGAPLAGAVSFHGGLSTPNPDDARNIRGKVLAFHGGDDPLVKDEEVLAFQDEMRKAGVDWQLVVFGGAGHSFTNPASGGDASDGVAYHARSDARSWTILKSFLEEAFAKK